MYGKILTPLNGSFLDELALRHAVELCHATGAELILLRVVQDPLAAVPEASVGVSPRVIYGAAIRAVKYLQGVSLRLGGEGIRIRTKVLEGEPTPTILCFARRENVDAIVMGTHARKGLSRLFWGSVAEEVAATTRRPVILVKRGKALGTVASEEYRKAA